MVAYRGVWLMLFRSRDRIRFDAAVGSPKTGPGIGVKVSAVGGDACRPVRAVAVSDTVVSAATRARLGEKDISWSLSEWRDERKEDTQVGPFAPRFPSSPGPTGRRLPATQPWGSRPAVRPESRSS